MTITPHPSYEFGFVDGLFVKAVADRGTKEDADRNPDFIPATEVIVKFTPAVSARKIVDAPSMYVTKTPTEAIVAQDGRLRLRGQISEPPGVGLIAGIYNVTFTGVPLAPIQIEVLPTHTEQNPLDLITVLPYEPGPNEVVHLVALPPGGEPGQVYGWTGSGIGWYTPEQAKGIASIEDSDGDGIATVTYTDATTSDLPLPTGPEGPAGPTDHSALTNRDAVDQHPISAITGLQAELDGKSVTGHTHSPVSIGAAPSSHTHDDRYYTESEVDMALTGKADASPLPYLLPTSKLYQFAGGSTNSYSGAVPNSIGLLPFIVVAPIALTKIFTSVHTSPSANTDLELVLYDPDGTLRVNAPVQVSTETTGKIAAVIDTTLDRVGLWTAGVRFFTEMNGLILHRGVLYPAASLVIPAGNSWDPATAQNSRGLHIPLGAGVSTPTSILGMEAQMGPSYAPLLGYEVS